MERYEQEYEPMTENNNGGLAVEIGNEDVVLVGEIINLENDHEEIPAAVPLGLPANISDQEDNPMVDALNDNNNNLEEEGVDLDAMNMNYVENNRNILPDIVVLEENDIMEINLEENPIPSSSNFTAKMNRQDPDETIEKVGTCKTSYSAAADWKLNARVNVSMVKLTEIPVTLHVQDSRGSVSLEKVKYTTETESPKQFKCKFSNCNKKFSTSHGLNIHFAVMHKKLKGQLLRSE